MTTPELTTHVVYSTSDITQHNITNISTDNTNHKTQNNSTDNPSDKTSPQM